MKVTDKKSFNQFIKFMKDESPKAQKERIQHYEENGGINAASKAKFIVSTLAPYFYDMVSKLQDTDEDTKNDVILDEFDYYFSKINEILKKPEQIEALDAEFKELNLQNDFTNFQKAFAERKQDIYGFTTFMFSTVFKNLQDGVEPDVLELREFISSEEVYELIAKKNKVLTDEEFTIGKTIINALLSDKASVNTEVVGRVYAYVRSGWAKADLFDLDTIDGKNSVADLNEAVTFLRENKFNLSSDERLEYEQKLAQAFNSRLNEIAVKITYNRTEQTCSAGLADLKADRTAGSGTADIAIQEYKNPGNLFSIYCTANHNLYFTNDNRDSWSLLSHQKINNKDLIGKSLSQIDVGNDSGLSKHLGKEYYNAKIENINVINLSPATLATKSFTKELEKAFDKSKWNNKEISLVDNYPIFSIVQRYTPDDKTGTGLNVNEIFNIKENILIGGSSKNNPWDELNSQFEYFKISEDKKEQFFYNNFFVPYVVDLWSLIKNKDLKEDYVISAVSSGTKEGRALSFVNTFPEFFNTLITKLSEEVDNGSNLFNSTSKEQILDIAKEIIEHPTYSSEKSKVTTSRDLRGIKNAMLGIEHSLEAAQQPKSKRGYR